MANKLTIDRGNTTTKLAVWTSREASSPLFSRTLLNATADDIMSAIGGVEIDKAIQCSVAGKIDGLDERLKVRGISLINIGTDLRLPIKIEYDTPSTLGADRIAALCGAKACYPDREVLVVDIGTAVTYDRLTGDGTFAGGNIAPGIGMRLKALHAFTSALPKINSSGGNSLWGTSTETAMRNGAINGVIAEITYYHSHMPQEALTVITGGWGADIAAQLPFNVEVNQLLVLHGLNSILYYNETE